MRKRTIYSKLNFLKIVLKEMIIEGLLQMPFLTIGLQLFQFATSLEVSGTITDFRIKLYIFISKMFISVWLGQVLQNIFFPKIELDDFLENVKNIKSEMFNIFQGRLITHFLIFFFLLYEI